MPWQALSLQQRLQQKGINVGRASASERGYDWRWQKARDAYLKEHVLCVECLKENRAVVATVVDHIKPHRGNQQLFWDSETNWQSLCETHHNQKTARGE